MSLSSVFRGNANICFDMAATTQNAEVRQQWADLGRYWQQKLEASQGGADTPTAIPKPFDTPSPSVVPTIERIGAGEFRFSKAPIRSLDEIWAEIANVSLE
jgi:hypothetical protein